MGSEQLKKEGERQNAEGKGQEAEGQLRDLGSGVCLILRPVLCLLSPKLGEEDSFGSDEL